MSVCGYSLLASPLRYGDVFALLACLFVTTGSMLLLGLVLERRWLRPRVMPPAFTIGDPALAIGISAGVHIIGPHRPCGIIGPPGQITACALWFVFGLWQWRAEITAKIYTRQQALSPTKIWHQLVICPCLGTWGLVATVGGLMNAGRNAAAVVLMAGCLAVWAGTWVHNVRHPRLGHPPYDWGHLRPARRRWGEESRTLRSAVR